MATIRNLALALTLTAAAGVGFAGGARAAGEVGDRLENRHDRIIEGYENGSLSKSEACHLIHQEKDLKRDREHADKHGMSGREREHMNAELNRESRKIHAERTNDDRGREHRNARDLNC